MCKPPDSTTLLWRSCHATLCLAMVASSGFFNFAISASKLPPKTISVPRPAMLVAIVIALGCPACATISASRSCCFAFNTSCFILAFFNIPERYSDTSMDDVPTKTGWLRF